MRLNHFIAHRIYKSKSVNNSFSRPAVHIATIGIAVGIIIMIISVSVVLGFKKEISNKVVGFNSHIQIQNPSQTDNIDFSPIIIDSALYHTIQQTPNLSKSQIFATKTGLIKTDNEFKGIQIKGVGEDYDLSFFNNYLIDGKIPDFSSKKSSNSILLSNAIASKLMLKVGDNIFVYFFDHDHANIRARKLCVSGIYNTHLEEFDNQICFSDLYTIRKLNGWNNNEATGLEIYLENESNIIEAMDYLIANINHNYNNNSLNTCYAYSMYELSPNIFSWLDILDTNVIMILVLMLIIGSFTIMAGLLIVMLDRIQMIGILNALGCSNRRIRKIFSNFAVLIVSKGIIIGDFIGIVLCFFQNYFSIIKLDPNTYYIDSVPISINWLYILFINIGVFTISSLVIIGSSFLMGIKEPAKNIKWD